MEERDGVLMCAHFMYWLLEVTENCWHDDDDDDDDDDVEGIVSM